MMEVVRIPAERVPILIGEKGSVKKRIEKMGSVKLKIGRDGRVEISGEKPYEEYKALNVVKAIGRGFNPDIAMKLFNDEFYLKIIDLRSILPTEKAMRRQKGRIIGERGKARRMIEECSGASISVYGHTVGIIGMLDEVSLAEEAIEGIIEGKSHARVFATLQKAKKRMKEERMLHMWQKRMEE